MQISTRQRDYVVDALTLRSHLGSALGPTLSDPSRVKVLHGADRDVEWLQVMSGRGGGGGARGADFVIVVPSLVLTFYYFLTFPARLWVVLGQPFRHGPGSPCTQLALRGARLSFGPLLRGQGVEGDLRAVDTN